MPDNISAPANGTENERRSSWSFAPILILYIISIALAFYSHMLAAALVSSLLLATLWSTFSKKEYDLLHQSYPHYTRGGYIWNSFLQHILIPWSILLSLITAGLVLEHMLD